MNKIQQEFKELLMSFTSVTGDKFEEGTVDNIIKLSNDEELSNFMQFISKDMSENGRFHIEIEGIMILLAEKNPNASAEDLIKLYKKSWR